MIAILLVGGFFRSLEFTAINAIAYAEIEPRRMSRATALASSAQQLSISTGVAVGALMVEASLRWHGSTTIGPGDFTLAFIVVAVISGSSAFLFGDCRQCRRGNVRTHARSRDQSRADRGRRDVRSANGLATFLQHPLVPAHAGTQNRSVCPSPGFPHARE